VRRPILVVLALVAAAAVVNLGFKLVGALRQIDTLAGARVGAANPVVSATLRATERASAPAGSRVPSAEAAGQTAAMPELPLRESEPPLRFDTEAALREASDGDPNVAEILNDPDPTVGGAVRDFITGLAPRGGN
jgi:hypothetical protein